MHEKLISQIQKTATLTRAEIEACRTYFEPVSLPKRHLLEQEGKPSRFLYYVVNGYVRVFHYSDGDEVTTHINCPPGFIGSHQSFLHQTISSDNVECVTDCDLLRISKPRLDALIEPSDTLKTYSIAALHESVAYNEARSNDLASLTAEERYLKLMKRQPDILQFVPLQHIASFLGIKPESLSRIRRQIFN